MLSKYHGRPQRGWQQSRARAERTDCKRLPPGGEEDNSVADRALSINLIGIICFNLDLLIKDQIDDPIAITEKLIIQSKIETGTV